MKIKNAHAGYEYIILLINKIKLKKWYYRLRIHLPFLQQAVQQESDTDTSRDHHTFPSETIPVSHVQTILFTENMSKDPPGERREEGIVFY